jgi:hypothetical protein
VVNRARKTTSKLAAKEASVMKKVSPKKKAQRKWVNKQKDMDRVGVVCLGASKVA